MYLCKFPVERGAEVTPPYCRIIYHLRNCLIQLNNYAYVLPTRMTPCNLHPRVKKATHPLQHPQKTPRITSDNKLCMSLVTMGRKWVSGWWEGLGAGWSVAKS